MRNEAKRAAQEALFTAIKTSAENNMKAALRASEKAQILRELAEAYRLAAGSPVSDMTATTPPKPNGSARKAESKDESKDDAAANGKAENGQAPKPKRRPSAEAASDSRRSKEGRREGASSR